MYGDVGFQNNKRGNSLGGLRHLSFGLLIANGISLKQECMFISCTFWVVGHFLGICCFWVVGLRRVYTVLGLRVAV